MKKIIMIILGLVLVSMAYARINVSPGVCTYDSLYILNDSVYELAEVCGDNISTQLAINLMPGEVKTERSGYCNITGTCTACTSESLNTCRVNDKIDPGETLNINSGACNVSVTADECEEVEDKTCKKGIPTEYDIPYEATYSDMQKAIIININGEEIHSGTIKNSSTVVTAKGSLKFTCPTQIINESNTADITYEACKSIVPLYCNELARVAIKQHEYCVEDKHSLEAAKKATDDRYNLMVDDMKDKICITNVRHAELMADGAIYKNYTGECQQEVGGLERDKQYLNEGIIFAMLIFAVSLMANIGLALKVRRLEGKTIDRKFR